MAKATQEPVDFKLWYEAVGIPIGPLKGKEYLSTCPECSKPKHWHVNKTTGQHHCKVCTFSGNHYTFMQWMLENGSRSDLSEIAEERGISVNTLEHAEFFKFNDEFWCPIFNDDKLVSLRKVALIKDKHTGKFKYSMLNLPKVGYEGTFLYQLHTTKSSNKVVVCEGYWDALALYDSFEKKDKIPYSIWAAPSANILRQKWYNRFSNKTVLLAFDNDKAGKEGIQKWSTDLREYCLEAKSIRWPSDATEGFDVRDLVKQHGQETSDKLLAMFDHYEPEAPKPTRTKFSQIINDLKEHGIKLDQQFTDVFAVALATAFVSHVEGDPLWIYIVGSPGSGKTLVTNSLLLTDHCFHVSKVTAAQLVSGRNDDDGNDPSLVPQLDNKTLVMKDYTEIIDMGGGAQAEMLSVLRGAYDRTLMRQYGNGKIRRYNSKFGIIAAVTGKIYQTTQAALGERFLRIHVGGKDPTDQIKAAMNAARDNPDLGKAVAPFVSAYLDYLKDYVRLEDIPQLSTSQQAKIFPIVRVIALLRTAIATGREKEDLEAPPEVETGARTAIQLQKLAWGLSIILNKPTIDEYIFNILRRVARDTCRGYYQTILQYCGRAKDGCTVKYLCQQLSLTPGPINRKIGILRQIGVLEPKSIKKNGPGKPEQTWILTKEFKQIWDKSGIGS